jgi:hypothetical protein
LIDAQTALDFLLDHPAIRNDKIFIYGQSLGGALAIQLVSRNQGKCNGLVLENTFRSMRTLIPSAFPPAKYLARLCHQIWPSETTLPQIEKTPILFLSGLKDELVPYVFTVVPIFPTEIKANCTTIIRPSHMKRLHEICISPKVWRVFPNGSHNDTYGELNYFESILEFISCVIRDELPSMISDIESVGNNIRIEKMCRTSASDSKGSSDTSSVL